MVTLTVPARRRLSTPRVPVAAFVEATAEVALALDDAGRIHRASEAFSVLFGHGSEAVARHRFTTLVHQDDAVMIDAALRAAADGETQLRQHRLRDANGNYRWVESTIQRFQSVGEATLLVVARDVQTRVAHEQSLLSEVAAYDDIFDKLREGVIVIDAHGVVVAVNDAAAGFLGVVRNDLRGSLARAHVTVLDEQGRPMPPERLPSTRAFRTGVAQHEAVQYRRRDGSSVWLLARTVPLFDPGELSPGRVAIFLENAALPEEDPVSRTNAIAAAAHDILTSREHEVLKLLARGDDVRAISTQLHITVHTTRGHVKQIMQKLGARTQLQAVVAALRSGLVQLD